MVVLFQPHNDDAALFAAYTCIRHKPYVITVLRSVLQEQRGLGITAEQRELEDDCAFVKLGLESWTHWPFSDAAPDWTGIENAMRILDFEQQPELVFAPAPELGGHVQHNIVGDLAEKVFGERTRFYLTYRRGHGRSQGVLVDADPEWAPIKLDAVRCYRSQILEPSTRPWFESLYDVREWETAA